MRLALGLAVLFGAALRLYPIHRPYVEPELQEQYPHDAVLALVEGPWIDRPSLPALVHGPVLRDALEGIFAVGYVIGRIAGAYRDRLDLLAAFLNDPAPFVLVGRIVVVAAGIFSLAAVGILGMRLHGPAAGLASVVLLAVTFVDVRQGHQVWPDTLAAAAVLGTVIAGLRARHRPGAGGVVLPAALAGLAIACKYSALPVVLSVAVAGVAGTSSVRAALGRLTVAAAVTLSVLIVLCRDLLVHPARSVLLLGGQLQGVYVPGRPALSLATLLWLGIGPGILALALVGLAAGARAAPARTALAAAFPCAYLLLLALGSKIFARYLALLAPFTALFAGHGAVVLGRALDRRHAGAVAAIFVLATGSGPVRQTLRYDRFLALDDTRRLAGDWLRRHVADGEPLTLPNIVDHPNPVVPTPYNVLRLGFGATVDRLRPRLVDPSRRAELGYIKILDRPSSQCPPATGIVVTAEHPAVLRALETDSDCIDRLRAAGARVVATFRGAPDRLPGSVIFDPLEADYVPLTGFADLERPGPNLTVWELPHT